MKNTILAVIVGAVIGAGFELWGSEDRVWSWFWPVTGALLGGLGALPVPSAVKGTLIGAVLGFLQRRLCSCFYNHIALGVGRLHS